MNHLPPGSLSIPLAPFRFIMKTPVPKFIYPDFGMKTRIFVKNSPKRSFSYQFCPETPVSTCFRRDQIGGSVQILERLRFCENKPKTLVRFGLVFAKTGSIISGRSINSGTEDICSSRRTNTGINNTSSQIHRSMTGG
jgi:hypothetical protein